MQLAPQVVHLVGRFVEHRLELGAGKAIERAGQRAQDRDVATVLGRRGGRQREEVQARGPPPLRHREPIEQVPQRRHRLLARRLWQRPERRIDHLPDEL
ncbi:MAG: hypothetical protein MUF60_02700, partial [Vicinamibacterales bacterium]|nr:hypothetical protein [Vicinamibacterales bacterium]